MSDLLLGANLGISMLFVLVAIRHPHRAFRIAASGLAVSSTCFLMAGPAGYTSKGDMLHALLLSVAATSVFWFWALCRALFEDHCAVRLAHWLIPIGLFFCGMLVYSDQFGAGTWPIKRLPYVVSLLLGAHLMWRVYSDRKDDLVEQRRTARLLFIAVGIIAPFTLAVMRRHHDFLGLETYFSETHLATQLLLKLLLGSFLFEITIGTSPPIATCPSEALATNTQHVDGDAKVLEKLNHVMQEELRFRQPGLTISQLAAQLAVPEYRLRQCINHKLGFRNFNDYLNSLRIRAISIALQDRTKAHIPILTLALEAGYGSIGPFNRAFKARFGITPSDYRNGSKFN